jgi:hypothetical protein
MSHRPVAGFISLIMFASLLGTNSSFATHSPTAETRKTLLTLNWHDAQGSPNKTTLNLEQLDALPQVERTQELPEPLEIPSSHVWQGISLRELLKISGTSAKSIRILALNGYYATIPIADIERYDPLLAYRRNGQNLTIRDKGPFILIYPFNDFRELNHQIYINRSVWQINEIHIE